MNISFYEQAGKAEHPRKNGTHSNYEPPSTTYWWVKVIWYILNMVPFALFLGNRCTILVHLFLSSIKIRNTSKNILNNFTNYLFYIIFLFCFFVDAENAQQSGGQYISICSRYYKRDECNFFSRHLIVGNKG